MTPASPLPKDIRTVNDEFTEASARVVELDCRIRDIEDAHKPEIDRLKAKRDAITQPLKDQRDAFRERCSMLLAHRQQITMGEILDAARNLAQ